MSDDIRRDIRTDHTVYDAGPSGTAVAGLIIALIALAVALYGAFAPRQVVREVSQTVMEPIEKATGGQETARPPQQTSQPAQSSQQAQPGQQGEKTSAQLSEEISKLKQDLTELRSKVVSGLETNQSKPATKQAGTPQKAGKK
jgi:hypothetical protein